MISSVPAVEICVTTGATLCTCGSLASTPPTLIGMGAPVSPAMKDDPGGSTMHVGADAGGAGARVLQHAEGQPDDQQDHA